MKNVSGYEAISFLSKNYCGETWLAKRDGSEYLITELNAQHVIAGQIPAIKTLASSIHHSNICEFVELLETETGFFAIYRACKGRILAELIRTNGPLSQDRVIRISTQINAALAYMHKRLLIHGSLSPENILIDESSSDAVNLLNPLLNKAINNQGLDNSLLAYQSPEQLYGSAAEAQTDFYALGLCTQYMLTGNHAFDAGSPNMRQAICGSGLDQNKLMTLNPNLRNLIVHLTALDPSKRLASSEGLYSKLVGIENNVPPAPAPENKPAPQIIPIPQPVPPLEQTQNQNPFGSPAIKSSLFSKIPKWMLAAIPIVLIGILGVIIVPKLLKKTPAFIPQEIPGMAFVQGGSFIMGDDFNLGTEGGKPTHTVSLSPFYIGMSEVTQADWERVMGYNPSKWRDPNRPVESISWYEAITYCDKLSILEGLTPCYNSALWSTGRRSYSNQISINYGADGYRLPTEAEWEFAARGGTNDIPSRFAGGDNHLEFAWTESNSGGRTSVVKMLKPNELGIYDMSGNVWEWCWDWYAPYDNESLNDPLGPPRGNLRTLRGGSYIYNSGLCLVSFRSYRAPSAAFENIGFRVCRSLGSSSSKSYTNQADAHNEIRRLTTLWNDAHNNRDINAFTPLYGSNVLFYGEYLSPSQCTGKKDLVLNSSYDYFEQNLRNIEIIDKENGRIRVNFDKDVKADDLQASYPSYLEFADQNGSWKIVRESDRVTDRNLGIPSD